MDYRGLLEQYNEIDKVSFKKGDTEEEVIQRLMEISREKKRIQTACNAIIKEFITKYEQDPGLLDSGAEALLKDFLNELMQGGQCMDTPIAFRISKLLLRFYQEQGDVDRIVALLEYCAVFDELSEGRKRSLINC